MIGFVEALPEQDPLVKRILGLYLRHAERYDRWGGEGKLAVVQEVLNEEGIELSRNALERIVNEVFPRTFPRPIPLPVSARLLPHLARYYQERLFDFAYQGLTARAALQETADRFECPVPEVERTLRGRSQL